jgi:hypothetical protein
MAPRTRGFGPPRPSWWSAPVSAAAAAHRAGGRRRYNAWRQHRAARRRAQLAAEFPVYQFGAVSEAARFFGVSRKTIQRDLAQLAAAQAAERQRVAALGFRGWLREQVRLHRRVQRGSLPGPCWCGICEAGEREREERAAERARARRERQAAKRPPPSARQLLARLRAKRGTARRAPGAS